MSMPPPTTGSGPAPATARRGRAGRPWRSRRPGSTGRGRAGPRCRRTPRRPSRSPDRGHDRTVADPQRPRVPGVLRTHHQRVRLGSGQPALAAGHETGQQLVDAIDGQRRIDADVGRGRPPAQRGGDSVDGVDGGLVGLPAGPEPTGRWRVVEEHVGVGVVGGGRDRVHQLVEAGRVPLKEIGCVRGGGERCLGVVVTLPAQVGRRPAVHHALVGEELADGPAGAGGNPGRQPGGRG